MGIRILASDLDGTLLDEKSEISESTAKAVRMAQSAGMRFIAVTGRSWTTAHSLLQKSGIDGDYMLLNGAEFRTSSGKVIYRESMDDHTAQQIIRYLSDVGIDFEINTDMGDYSTDTTVCETASEIPDLKQFWNQNPKILKIFIFTDIAAHLREIRRYLQCLNGVTVTSSAACNIEVTSAAVGKGRMLKKQQSIIGFQKKTSWCLETVKMMNPCSGSSAIPVQWKTPFQQSAYWQRKS